MCTASLFYNIEFPSVLSKEDRSDKQQLPCGKKKSMQNIFLPYFQCVWFLLQYGLQNLSLIWVWSYKLTEELCEDDLDVKAAFSLC